MAYTRTVVSDDRPEPVALSAQDLPSSDVIDPRGDAGIVAPGEKTTHATPASRTARTSASASVRERDRLLEQQMSVRRGVAAAIGAWTCGGTPNVNTSTPADELVTIRRGLGAPPVRHPALPSGGRVPVPPWVPRQQSRRLRERGPRQPNVRAYWSEPEHTPLPFAAVRRGRDPAVSKACTLP